MMEVVAPNPVAEEPQPPVALQVFKTDPEPPLLSPTKEEEDVSKRERVVGGKSKKSNVVPVPIPLAIDLVEKPQLTVADVTCPICWSIMYKPTTLPCKHSLCMGCYLEHADKTSLSCPCCRRRCSVWDRQATKRKKLLDETLWTRLKLEFEDLITARENGDDSQDLLFDPPKGYVRDAIACETPGQMLEELQGFMKDHLADLKKQHLEAESASIRLLEQLRAEEEELSVQYKEQEKEDFELARKLQNKLNRSYQRNHLNEMGGLNEPRKSKREQKPNRKYEFNFVCELAPKRIIKVEKKPKIKKESKTILTKTVLSLKQDPETVPSTENPTPGPSSGKLSPFPCPTMPIPKAVIPQVVDLSTVKAEPEEKSVQVPTTSSSLSDSQASSTASQSRRSQSSRRRRRRKEDDIVPSSDSEEIGDASDEIDLEAMKEVADDVSIRLQRKLQEYADLEFAKTLQKSFNLGIYEPRDKNSKNKYSLRAWK